MKTLRAILVSLFLRTRPVTRAELERRAWDRVAAVRLAAHTRANRPWSQA